MNAFERARVAILEGCCSCCDSKLAALAALDTLKAELDAEAAAAEETPYPDETLLAFTPPAPYFNADPCTARCRCPRGRICGLPVGHSGPHANMHAHRGRS